MSNHQRYLTTVCLTLLLTLITVNPASAQFSLEEEPISYSKVKANGPIARLQRRIDAGKVTLKFDEQFGYLPSMLQHLKVPVSSQTLVFSKTSFQRHRISPRTPRALYFSDDIYLGWVQKGEVMEISSVDPDHGAIFYSLEQKLADKPKFIRQTDRCLLCHASPHTNGVPGHIVRSVFSNAGGMPIFSTSTFRIDHTSPFQKRWGGWYVTGTHGDQKHMGNMIVRNHREPESTDRTTGANITDLSKRFRTVNYLSGHSDIVALMVLEHQVKMHNLITQANYEARLALRDERVIQKMLNKPNPKRSASIQRRFENSGNRLLKYMLFVDEAKLTAPIKGTSGYAEEFPLQGPRDNRNRSLRDFDLQSRMFKYPCSYLIYSEAFDSLPQPILNHVYRRLWEILTNQEKMAAGKEAEEKADEFAHLSPSDRQAILEILRDTKKDLPKYWKAKPVK